MHACTHTSMAHMGAGKLKNLTSIFSDFRKPKNPRKNLNFEKRWKTPPKRGYTEAVYQISGSYNIWKVFEIDLQKRLCEIFTSVFFSTFESRKTQERNWILKNGDRRHLKNGIKKLCTKFQNLTTSGRCLKSSYKIGYGWFWQVFFRFLKVEKPKKKMRILENGEKRHLKNGIKKLYTKFQNPTTYGRCLKSTYKKRWKMKKEEYEFVGPNRRFWKMHKSRSRRNFDKP